MGLRYMAITIPHRKRGRQSKEAVDEYQQDLNTFCNEIIQINSTLDFKVSSRGWCYILEEHGLLKSDFDKAQVLLNDCRKNGMLPLDICAEDKARTFLNLESIDDNTPQEEAKAWIDYIIESAWQQYTPLSFWDDRTYYVQMLVEKIDLVNMFLPICESYRIPIANAKGWADMNQRGDMMRRFNAWEQEGKTPVLLYCGDHDPAGLAITNHLRNNLRDLSKAVGWFPDNLIIDRFGLNYDFIQANNLTWIDNLITGSGKDLANPKHADHKKPYVQNYFDEYGVRKVEANALVTRLAEGRQLCLDAVNKYISRDAPRQYDELINIDRFEVENHINSQLKDRFAS